jgi:uncharacterized protein (DUF433 family)
VDTVGGTRPGDTFVEVMERITVDRDVLAGRPIIKGTSITVEFIIGLMAQGWSEGQILANYPSLERADIRAALEFARQRVEEERVFPI